MSRRTYKFETSAPNAMTPTAALYQIGELPGLTQLSLAAVDAAAVGVECELFGIELGATVTTKKAISTITPIDTNGIWRCTAAKGYWQYIYLVRENPEYSVVVVDK